MKKVCHMTSAHKTDDGRIFRKECTSLAQCGYDVYLVGRGESREDNGVHVIGVGENVGGRLSRMLGFSRKVYKAALAVDAEVYHFHDPELLPYGLKLKKKGKKVIFDSHEMYSQQIREKKYLGCFSKIIERLYASYEASVVHRLDAVIVVTPQMEKAFCKYQPVVCTIANYPMLSSASPEDVKKTKALCFAGGVKDEWNHTVVLKAMEELPTYTYNLCGPYDDESYMQTLKSMEAWSRVNYKGRVSFFEAQQLIRTSSIGVALLEPGGNTDNLNGTLGNTKLFEIMMAGLPVVCTDFVLWKKIIDKYRCGIYVKPNDASAVAKAVQYIDRHQEEAKQMGENGKRAVLEEFNWNIEEKKLIEFYGLL